MACAENFPQPPTDALNEHHAINQTVARFAILRLISIQLHAVGFTRIENKCLLEDIEALVSGLLDGLVHLTYAVAQHTRRSRPNVRDLLAACGDQGIELYHLERMLSARLPDLGGLDFQLPLAPSTKAGDPTANFLPSDPESDDDGYGTSSAHLRKASRRLTSESVGSLRHLPALPAKHTWRHTTLAPAPTTLLPPEHLLRPSPIPAATSLPNMGQPDIFRIHQGDPNAPSCLSLLNKRILGTRLVECSLKNLAQPNFTPTSQKPPRVEQDNSLQPELPAKAAYVTEKDIPIINFEHDWYPSLNGQIRGPKFEPQS